MKLENPVMLVFLAYYAVVAVISVAITVFDKSAAKKGSWRVSEFMLMMFGLAGGALPMLVTMKKIRHKTKHMKFVICVPVLFLLQVALIWLIYTQMNRI